LKDSVETVLADGGNAGADFAAEEKLLTDDAVQVAERPDLKNFAAVPKRWIVERSFAWMDKCRYLRKNREIKLRTAVQMVKLVFIRILCNIMIISQKSLNIKDFWLASQSIHDSIQGEGRVRNGA
jgi:transposase